LFIQRMNLRQIATTLVTRSSNRTQGQDDDDDQNIDDDRRDQIKQSNQIDDGQDIGIDNQGNPIQQKRKKQSTIAAGALGVGSQPRQKVAQQRGRRSQYLMDLTPPSSPSTLMMQQEAIAQAEQMNVMAQLQQQQLHLDPSLLQQQDQMQIDPSLLQQQLSEQQLQQLQQQQMRMMQGQQDQGDAQQ
ncbi:MAG: hypothetical protein EZS28_037222, partial [Streblomastix strix]